MPIGRLSGPPSHTVEPRQHRGWKRLGALFRVTSLCITLCRRYASCCLTRRRTQGVARSPDLHPVAGAEVHLHLRVLVAALQFGVTQTPLRRLALATLRSCTVPGLDSDVSKKKTRGHERCP